MRHLNQQDLQTLLHSDENYYNSKRSNNQSFQNFIRILIVAFLGAFIVNTPWGSLHVPVLAYAGTILLIISILLNIYAYPIAQRALDESREATHKTFNENDISYINEIPKAYKNLSALTYLLIACLTLSIVICPTSYIIEKTLATKEVTQMAKKQQPTQQTSRKTGTEKNERLWDTPSRPITPTSDTPAQQPAQPTQQPAQPAQPAQQPTQPTSDTKPSTEKN